MFGLAALWAPPQPASAAAASPAAAARTIGARRIARHHRTGVARKPPTGGLLDLLRTPTSPPSFHRKLDQPSTGPRSRRGMFEIGATLREAREKRGLSPADVHRELRIRERYLTALEEERWELLPGEAYTKGFLRGYAEFLGLNGTLYVDEFNARVAEHDEEPFVPDTFARDGRRTSRILFRTIAGVIVVGGAVAAASALVHGGSPASTLPPPARARTAAPHHIAGVRAAPKPRTPTAGVRLLGRCWFSIRRGGANGREVFRGFLTRGEHRTYVLSNAVWIRIGRPSAVAITIGTRTIRRAGDRPVNLLLTKAGARAA